MNYIQIKGFALTGLHRLEDIANEANNRAILVGVPAGPMAEAPHGKHLPMAVVAARNEFGSGAIPERSFLRGGVRRGRPKFHDVNAHSLKAVVNGKMSINEATDRLGVVAVGEVKREFIVGNFAPNAQSTIDRKGSSRPLIDTGNLRQTITYEHEGRDSSLARVIL